MGWPHHDYLAAVYLISYFVRILHGLPIPRCPRRTFIQSAGTHAALAEATVLPILACSWEPNTGRTLTELFHDPAPAVLNSSMLIVHTFCHWPLLALPIHRLVHIGGQTEGHNSSLGTPDAALPFAFQ